MSNRIKLSFLAILLSFFCITSFAAGDVTSKVQPLIEGQSHEETESLSTIAWIDNYRPNTVIVYTYDDYGNLLTMNYLDPGHYLELYNPYNIGYFNVYITKLNDRTLFDGVIYNGATLKLYK